MATPGERRAQPRRTHGKCTANAQQAFSNAKQTHGNRLADALLMTVKRAATEWQTHSKRNENARRPRDQHMGNASQTRGKCTVNAWHTHATIAQTHGKRTGRAWQARCTHMQTHGKRVADAWQMHGKPTENASQT